MLCALLRGRILVALPAQTTRSMSRYAGLSRDELVARLEALESGQTLNNAISPSDAGGSSSQADATIEQSVQRSSPKAGRKGKTKQREPIDKPFHFAAHPTRHIALLIAYHGWPYSGLAIQENGGNGAGADADAQSPVASSSTSSPTVPKRNKRTEPEEIVTVEGELFKALEKTRLIEAGKGPDGCGFSRCGRTDRGVSGHGQVVNLWVRSGRKDPSSDGGSALDVDSWRPAPEPAAPKPVKSEAEIERQRPKKPVPTQPVGELSYPRLLNAVLPSSIRVLAWSPVSAEFDSRFSCKYRHYKYAFHARATPHAVPLDLDLMQQGVDRLIGEHDFRNYCKVDGSKQIENYNRRVVKAFFEKPRDRDDSDDGGMVIFNLIGSAFLWHQVRHIMAVLFLVGSKLEPVTLVSDLLNIGNVPAKPSYQMGDPIPLTLHECGYDESALDWRFAGYDGRWAQLDADTKTRLYNHAMGGLDALERQIESERQEAEIKTWQIGGAVRKLDQIFGSDLAARPEGDQQQQQDAAEVIVPLGGGNLLMTSKYKAVMDRSRGDTPETVNRKWREARLRNGKRIPKMYMPDAAAEE